MTVAETLARVESAGVRLRLEAGRLLASPRERLTDEVRELVRENKAAIMAALAEPSLEAQAELRRLLTEIAGFAPSYWKPSDVEEAVTVAMTDLDNALMTFRALAEQYRRGH